MVCGTPRNSYCCDLACCFLVWQSARVKWMLVVYGHCLCAFYMGNSHMWKCRCCVECFRFHLTLVRSTPLRRSSKCIIYLRVFLLRAERVHILHRGEAIAATASWFVAATILWLVWFVYYIYRTYIWRGILELRPEWCSHSVCCVVLSKIRSGLKDFRHNEKTKLMIPFEILFVQCDSIFVKHFNCRYNHSNVSFASNSF